MRLLIGTSNQGKTTELSDALQNADITVISPGSIGITDSPPEEGATFRENAHQKALFYHGRSGLPTLADDSGILVEALQQELGIHTRRWGAGPEATDAEWISFFLKRMSEETKKKARFICCLCYLDAQSEPHFFEGSCDGAITEELEAAYLPGLPISACFKPDGMDRVYSSLTVHEKNLISHRGRALQQFIKYLQGQPSV